MNRVALENIRHEYNSLLLELDRLQEEAKSPNVNTAHLATVQVELMEWYLEEYRARYGLST